MIKVVEKKKTVVIFVFSLLVSLGLTFIILNIISNNNILVNLKDKIELYLKFVLFLFSSFFLFLNFNVFFDLLGSNNVEKEKKLSKILRILLSITLLLFFYIFLYKKYASMDFITIIYYSFFYEYLLIGTLFSILLSTNISKFKKFIFPIQKYLKQKIKLSYGYLFFVSPAVGLALMEILNLSTIESIDLDFLFVNYLLYTLIHVFFYMIFRRIKLTSFFSLMLIYYVAIANYFVISFRGIPIIFGDIYSVKTAFSVSGGYDFTLNSNFTTSVLIFSAAVFLLLASSEKNYNKNEKIEELFKSSIVFITLIVITLFVYNSGFYFKDTTHTHWEPSSKFKKYGYLSSFIYDFTKTVSVEIDDYSVGEVDKILSKYPKDENLSDANHKPNIIVVMNEAFSDFDFIGDFETNKDYLPFYRSLEDNTIKGILTTSPERGGGTGYTEFEFLTGNSMAFLKGTNPYVQFINSDMPSMVSTLKDQNYQVLAMHPYKKTGYNRVSVYSHFGFEDFITMDSFDNPETVRGNISDLENYKKLIELYENRNKDKSFFIFNITMQNHGGYFDTGYEFKNPIEVTSYDVREDVDIFLSLMKESDLAFEYLINYFKNIGEDTLILIFGDHQPMLDDNFTEALFDKPLEDLSLEEKVKLYQVPFLIWANYDIEDRDIEKISINYLSSLLLDTAGVKTTSYNNYLLNQYRKMPIITANFYYDNKGDVYSFQESTILSDVIHDYEMIQYNNIFDLKNRLNKYFYIKN